MDPATQETMRPVVLARLKEIEDELEAGAEATKAVAPDVSIGRLSRLDSIQMQQMALAAKRRLEEERARLNEALQRINSGTYGRCLRCDDDIALERLRYQPDAVVCMPCLSAATSRKR